MFRHREKPGRCSKPEGLYAAFDEALVFGQVVPKATDISVGSAFRG